MKKLYGSIEVKNAHAFERFGKGTLSLINRNPDEVVCQPSIIDIK